MSYVFLGLYAAISVIHLIHSWQDNKKKRKYTKPFLLFFLILFAVFYRPGEVLPILLLLALVTSWLGDILLIPAGHGWFTAGGISFLLSHIFFILTYAGNILYDKVVWWVLVPVGIVYFVVAFLIIRAVLPTTPKAMIPPMYLYLLANSTMNVFALMQLFSYRSAAAVIAYIGALLFYISDCTLFLVRYYKKDPNLIFKRHFTVMLTYLAGELLIVLGVLNLAGRP